MASNQADRVSCRTPPGGGLKTQISLGVPRCPWATMSVGLESRGTWLPTRLDPRNPVGWKQSQSLTPVASIAT